MTAPPEPPSADAAPEADEPAGHLAHTWEEARQAAFDCASPIPPGPVPLRSALGRTLAADVTALQDIPHYASSAMDGWAVNGTGPWILADAGQRLAPHQASVIVTGGLIPPGAKAVLRSESGVMSTDDEGLPVLALGGTAANPATASTSAKPGRRPPNAMSWSRPAPRLIPHSWPWPPSRVTTTLWCSASRW
jgi:molybdopterin molybdotransferase